MSFRVLARSGVARENRFDSGSETVGFIGLGYSGYRDNRYEPTDVSTLWYLDSGYARHMIGNQKLLSEVVPHKGSKIVFGDNAYGNTVGNVARLVPAGMNST
ncbi:hypothetical protein F511_10145 [Dorcoceras hygrometricum]|uniref:Uncharacterized protein n=1 Tax=Dorcoceras hygrometricum TaxID=472368 RepID=A0A2Z7BRR6_9LAMI|nr:hypothetical protein F511_10145 [Dorcoceras hygrometricum]